MDQPITLFDWVVLAVIMASGLLALTRGFVRELLSVSAFIIAAFASLWMFPVLREPARNVISSGWIADLTAVGAVFILVYLAVTLITSSLSARMRGEKEPGLIDRLSGFGFGIVRGLVVLALAVIVISAFAPQNRDPGWMTEARLYPLLNSTARVLQDLAPEGSTAAERRLPDAQRSARQDAEETADPEPEEEPAYEEGQRQSLDQLITTRTGSDEDN